MSAASFDALRHLRRSVVFKNLEDDVLERFATCLTPVELAAGDLLMAEGDRGGDAWIVVTGRLLVWTEVDGSDTVLAELGPGSLVGEMSLLTGADRSASVQATRHSRLLRLPADDFNRIVLEDSTVLLQIARTLVRRLDRSIHNHRGRPNPSILGIAPAGGAPDHMMFAEQFATAVPGQDVTIVDRSSVERALGEGALDERAPATELMAYLHRIEVEHDMTLLVADDADGAWTRLCIRHADVNLLVGHASGLTSRGAAESVLLSEAETPGRPETHLIVLRVAGSPTGTSRIRAGRDVARVHHVFAWDDNDLGRVARIVSGASVGLVLGGGGARGFAHLGAIRALMEARIPIDHVGGASIGAVVAGIYALGGKWDEMVGKALMATVERKSLIDFSFPAVALAAGERLGISIRDIFADEEIEDLALDFFCTSTDLTTGSVHVHTSGALWRAIRASVSIPGIFPPVSGPDGRVLVDGGVLDNLPVDVMRRFQRPKVIIASDVQGSAPLPSGDLGDDGVVSGWSVAGRRYAWRTSPMEVPRMIDTLMSASAVTGRHSGDEADLVLRPPVDGYAILDFKSHAAIIEAGYQHAVERLTSWDDPSDSWP